MRQRFNFAQLGPAAAASMAALCLMLSTGSSSGAGSSGAGSSGADSSAQCHRMTAALEQAVASPRGAAATVGSQALTSQSKAESKRARAVSRFVGNYRFSGGAADRRARNRAIEGVVSEMNFLIRAIARSRIKKATPIAQRISIQAKGKNLTIRIDGRTYTGPLDGTTVRVIGSRGDEVSMRYRISANHIVQALTSDGEGRTNTFRLDKNGRIRMGVRIFSERLPKDLKFGLSYSRQK